MQHQGTQRLETARLILRQLSENDAPAMYTNWASDQEVTRFLTWPPHESVAATQELLTSWAKNYEQANFYLWGITLETNPTEVIGTISVVSADERIAKMEIGYCLGQAWWGQGIMSEALIAVVRFLFESVGVNRLESRHDPRNPGSGAVLKKAGFLTEGLRRQADWNNLGICDVILYGLLRADYDHMQEQADK